VADPALKGIFAIWKFDSDEVLLAAAAHVLDERETMMSWGIGERQYEGFDITEGQLTVDFPGRKLRWCCDVTSETDIAELNNEDMWLSPAPIEVDDIVVEADSWGAV